MRSTLPTFNEIWQRKFRDRLLTQAQQFSPKATFLIGCSGGMDSMLLLHLMSEIFPKRVRAIYIDHQLQTSSHEWGVFVQSVAEKKQIPCVVQRVHVAAGNLENQAREARYLAFEANLVENEILVLAHHQQDQSETVLLRLLSGSGVHGLAAMKEVEIRESISCWRPFLSLSRQSIEQWVTALELPFVQDLTNFDVQYDRAWCREMVWSLLEQRFPKMQSAISRTSLLMQDADEILTEVVQQDLKLCGDEKSLKLEHVLQLSSARQRQLLSYWMKGDGQYRPAFDMVERLKQEVIFAKPDAQAALHWNADYYVRYQKILYKVKKEEYLAHVENKPTALTVTWRINQNIALASGYFAVETSKLGLSKALLGRELKVVPRQGGEKIHLYGRVGHWALKKAIQEAQILPWLRHTIQILMIDNVMLGVFTPNGFWLAQSEYCETDGWLPVLVVT